MQTGMVGGQQLSVAEGDLNPHPLLIANSAVSACFQSAALTLSHSVRNAELISDCDRLSTRTLAPQPLITV